MSNEWGGYYNTDQHPSCSLLKSTSLPGCAESSSSETVESSSSEFAESSSSEKIDSSSSEDENSSSSDGEECGTGTGHCPVSSSASGTISSVQSSSSEESSSSIGKSSSSENSSSSVKMEFSSSNDETESSSSNENESSSSLGDGASSSSLQIESSSSEFVYSSSDNGVFVAGGDQVHSPDQIIRDGLDNMEPGSCYSLNPARGTQYGWMNTDAKDSWWWREVDCETGEKVDRNRVGVCPGFPLDNVPGNKNACFAYNGTCYKCNPDRGSECSNSWLWQGTFTSANVGWWYEKVDCDNPFEEITEACFEIDLSDDGIALLKRTEKNVVKYANITENNMENSISTIYYYDLLGRNLEYHAGLNLEQPIYSKRKSKKLNILSKESSLNGYVKGTPRLNICIKENKIEGVVKYLKIKGSLRIVVGNLHYQGNDGYLIAHEKKHKEIWSDAKYRKNWEYIATVTTSQTIYEACMTAFERLWGLEIQKSLTDVYKAQNDWDDEDEHNACESRIDINQELVENKAKLLRGACGRYRGK